MVHIKWFYNQICLKIDLPVHSDIFAIPKVALQEDQMVVGSGYNFTINHRIWCQHGQLPYQLIIENSLMFAKDLFGKIRHHLEIAKINTRKHNLCTW